MQVSFVLKGDGDGRHTVSTADVNQFLQHIETKFSDVLIPANQILTQEYIGKGFTYVYMHVHICYSNTYNLGAFGLVHKGELRGVDGAVSPVAIKTIKCK